MSFKFPGTTLLLTNTQMISNGLLTRLLSTILRCMHRQPVVVRATIDTIKSLDRRLETSGSQLQVIMNIPGCGGC